MARQTGTGTRTPYLRVRPQRLHQAAYPPAQALRLRARAVGAGSLVRRARAVLARRGALNVFCRRRALVLRAALPPGVGGGRMRSVTRRATQCGPGSAPCAVMASAASAS